MNAIMEAFAAHHAMSKLALDSERVRTGIKDVLFEPARLYEALRARSERPGFRGSWLRPRGVGIVSGERASKCGDSTVPHFGAR